MSKARLVSAAPLALRCPAQGRQNGSLDQGARRCCYRRRHSVAGPHKERLPGGLGSLVPDVCPDRPLPCRHAAQYDRAKAAMAAAQNKLAEKCAPSEYESAQADLKAAEAKMAAAKEGGNKTELYKQAKADLIAAQEKANAAAVKAEQNKKASENIEAKLAELKKEIDALKDDAGRSRDYSKLVMKYERTKELAEACKADEAKEMLGETEESLKNMKAIVAAQKAEAMKDRMKKNDALSGKTVDYKVVKGDSLWKISELKYYNPFMWPMIYWANKTSIKDPDLIFPGQVFKIKGNYNDSEKNDAIKFSKTRGPWSLYDNK